MGVRSRQGAARPIGGLDPYVESLVLGRDPSVSPGYRARPGSRVYYGGTWWFKNGTADTAWVAFPLTFGGGTGDHKLLVTGADPTSGYLDDKFRVGDDMSKAVGSGLGGQFVSVNLAPTGVAEGTYAYPSSVEVDGKGRITAITAGSRTTVQVGALGTPLGGAVALHSGAGISLTQVGQDITFDADAAPGPWQNYRANRLITLAGLDPNEAGAQAWDFVGGLTGSPGWTTQYGAPSNEAMAGGVIKMVGAGIAASASYVYFYNGSTRAKWAAHARAALYINGSGVYSSAGWYATILQAINTDGSYWRFGWGGSSFTPSPGYLTLRFHSVGGFEENIVTSVHYSDVQRTSGANVYHDYEIVQSALDISIYMDGTLVGSGATSKNNNGPTAGYPWLGNSGGAEAAPDLYVDRQLFVHETANV